jgi:hypothetical protein
MELCYDKRMRRGIQVCLKCGYEEVVFIITDKENAERGIPATPPVCGKCQSVMVKYKGN